jgi:hypothetical protein
VAADHDNLNLDKFPYCTEVLLKLKKRAGETPEETFAVVQV